MKIAIHAFLLMLVTATTAGAQITDSSGQGSGSKVGYGDAIYSSSWNRISGKPEHYPSRWQDVENKPAQATRWPSWSEVTGKPTNFTPAPHHHDSRYIRRDASGSIGGNLSVSGTVTGNRLVTGDVGGDRWCRANSAGRIQCTHSAAMSLKNCQICIQMGDDMKSKDAPADLGVPQCAPADGTWTPWATDENGFDPDAVRVSFQCTP